MVSVTYSVRRWYQIAEPAGRPNGERVLRTHVSISTYPTVEEALAGYEAARRGRWVPADAVADGVEAIGWRVPGVTGIGCGPREAIERLERKGATDAAEALRKVLERRQRGT